MKRKAFTLVELIVVITILAILGTISFMSFQGYSESSRDSVRISDVGNIKTSLELFQLNSGKYPIPDNGEEVSYSGDLLWTQGFFGEIVTKNLSRNLTKKPLDPLTDLEYIYSVSNIKNEYQLLSLMESDNYSFNNFLNKTNASEQNGAKLDGQYNGVFIRTPNYIVATPSLINSEVGSGGLIIDSENINSQVIHRGKNLPKYGKIESKTGSLDMNLGVYVGKITSDTSDAEKLLAIETIKNAYSGSQLENVGNIERILSAEQENDLLVLVEELLIGNGVAKSYYSCNSVTYNGYDVPYISHGEKLTLTKTTTNGNISFEVSCNDGNLLYGNEYVSCNETSQLNETTQLCDSMIVGDDTIGRKWGDNTIAKSCNEYKNTTASGYVYAGSTGDGVYWIDPENNGTGFQAYCDMTTDGGGWTLLVSQVEPYYFTSSNGNYYVSEGIGLVNRYSIISKHTNFTSSTYSGFYEFMYRDNVNNQDRWVSVKQTNNLYATSPSSCSILNYNIASPRTDLFDCFYKYTNSAPSTYNIYGSYNSNWQFGIIALTNRSTKGFVMGHRSDGYNYSAHFADRYSFWVR